MMWKAGAYRIARATIVFASILGEGEKASLKAAFVVFQDVLAGGTAVEQLDPDTLRALESLGYVC